MATTSAIDTLLNACEKHSNERGALHITDSYSKRKGTFYMKDGAIYAVELEGQRMPLLERLQITNRIEDYGTLSNTIHEAGGEDSLDLPYALLQGQFVDQTGINEVIKDFFLTMSHEILAWESVKSTWAGKVYHDGYPLPPIEGGKLIEVLIRRQEKIDTIGEAFGLAQEDLLTHIEVSTVDIENDYDTMTPEEILVAHAGSEEPVSLSALPETFFMTPHSVISTAYDLWAENHATILVDGVDIDANTDESIMDALESGSGDDVVRQMNEFLLNSESDDYPEDNQEDNQEEPTTEDDTYEDIASELELPDYELDGNDDETEEIEDFTVYEEESEPAPTFVTDLDLDLPEDNNDENDSPEPTTQNIESVSIANATFSGATFQHTILSQPDTPPSPQNEEAENTELETPETPVTELELDTYEEETPSDEEVAELDVYDLETETLTGDNPEGNLEVDVYGLDTDTEEAFDDEEVADLEVDVYELDTDTEEAFDDEEVADLEVDVYELDTDTEEAFDDEEVADLEVDVYELDTDTEETSDDEDESSEEVTSLDLEVYELDVDTEESSDEDEVADLELDVYELDTDADNEASSVGEEIADLELDDDDDESSDEEEDLEVNVHDEVELTDKEADAPEEGASEDESGGYEGEEGVGDPDLVDGLEELSLPDSDSGIEEFESAITKLIARGRDAQQKATTAHEELEKLEYEESTFATSIEELNERVAMLSDEKALLLERVAEIQIEMEDAENESRTLKSRVVAAQKKKVELEEERSKSLETIKRIKELRSFLDSVD